MNRDSLILIVETFLSDMRKGKISRQKVQSLRIDRDKANSLDTTGQKVGVFSTQTLLNAQKYFPYEGNGSQPKGKEEQREFGRVPEKLKNRFSNKRSASGENRVGGNALHGDVIGLSPKKFFKSDDIESALAHEEGHRLVKNVTNPIGDKLASEAREKKDKGEPLSSFNKYRLTDNEYEANEQGSRIRPLNPQWHEFAIGNYLKSLFGGPDPRKKV